MRRMLAISLAVASSVAAITLAPGEAKQRESAADPAKCEAPAKFVNGKVQPGLVHWHRSIEEAQASSGRSGKPVFVLQMLGRMDDHFC